MCRTCCASSSPVTYSRTFPPPSITTTEVMTHSSVPHSPAGPLRLTSKPNRTKKKKVKTWVQWVHSYFGKWLLYSVLNQTRYFNNSHLFDYCLFFFITNIKSTPWLTERWCKMGTLKKQSIVVFSVCKMGRKRARWGRKQSCDSYSKQKTLRSLHVGRRSCWIEREHWLVY